MKHDAEKWGIDHIRKEVAAKNINVQPDFQRFYIWDRKKEQSFIDSILRGYPIPPIWVWQHRKGRKTVFDVIDGQQRITCLSEFIDNRFPYKQPDIDSESVEDLGKFNNGYFDKKPKGERKAVTLDDEKKDQLLSYRLTAIVIETPDRNVVIDIFKRLNKSSTNLSPQELRNAFYSGKFKNFIYNMTAELQRNRFWGDQKRVFAPSSTDRMGTQQFVSELVVAMMEGRPLDRSDKLDDYYDDFDAKFRHEETVEQRFRDILKIIKKVLPGPSRFTRNTSDFYALFLLIDELNNRKNLRLDDRENIAALAESLQDFQDSYAEFSERRGKRGTNLSIFEDYRESVVGRQRELEMREARISILKNLVEPGLKFQDIDPIRHFSNEQRLYIWQRNRVCSICQQKIESEAEFEADHIKPWSKGGRTLISNGQAVHKVCNQSKSNH